MRSPRFLPPPQQKPPLGSEVDWGHSLSRGLVICAPCADGAGLKVANLAGNAAGRILGNSQWASTPRGMGITCRGTADGDYVSFPFPSQLTPNTPWTVSWVGRLNVAPVLRCIWNLATSTQRLGICYWADSTYGGVLVGATPLSGIGHDTKVSLDLSAKTQELHQWHCTYNGSAARAKLFFEGRDVSLDSASALSPAYTNDFNFSHGLSTYNANQTIVTACVWARALTPDEVRWLAAEPYAMIRYAGPRRRYFTVTNWGQQHRLQALRPAYRLTEQPARFRLQPLPPRFKLTELPPRFVLRELRPKFRLTEAAR